MIRFMHKILMLAMLSVVAYGVILPTQPAYAQELDIDACVSMGGMGAPQPHQYSSKIVRCVIPALVVASREIAVELANYMIPTVITMAMFAIAWLGVQMISGERQVTQKSITLLIKIGVVALFYLNAGSIINIVFGVLHQFLTLINGGYAPWDHMDSLLGKLIGFLPTLTVDMGLLGILGATFLSSTTGIFMFLTGITALLDIFFFFFNVLFAYLMAVTLIAFMIALMPLFAPLLMFYYTEKYFTKWWTIVVSAMLVPILMFTFLYFFLNVFNYVVTDIFRILGFPCPNAFDLTSCDQPDYSAYWKLNQPMFAWLMPADPSLSQQLHNVAGADEISTPAVQSNVNPLLRRALNNNMMNTPGVHFGPNHEAIVQELIYAFISLWLVASLMKSIIAKIPGIADDITGALNRITLEPTQIERQIRGATNPESRQRMAASVSDNVKQTVERVRNMSSGSRQQQPTQNRNT